MTPFKNSAHDNFLPVGRAQTEPIAVLLVSLHFDRFGKMVPHICSDKSKSGGV